MVSNLWRIAALPIVVLGISLTSAAWCAPPQAAPTTFDLEVFDADALEEAVRQGSTYTLTYFGETHELSLQRTHLRSSRFRMLTGSLDSQQLAFSGPPRTYSGTVVGEANSIVRMSTSKSGLRGYIKTGEGWTFIEPATAGEDDGGGAAAVAQAELAQPHRVFTENDFEAGIVGNCMASRAIDPDHGAFELPTHTVSSQISSESIVPPTAEAGALRVLEIAVDADVEFFQTHGAGSLAEIEAVLNVVDGIFRNELDLTIELVSVNIYETEPDPYTSTNSGTLLQELRNHWNANHPGIARDAAHLFTGKELDSSTIGIAYVGVVCSTTVSYALSQDLVSPTLMPILVAHELGHNLNADHDAALPRHIMYPSLGITNLDEFTAATETTIGNFVAAVGCLALSGESGDGSGSSSGSGGGGGGGGGGGPVDPLLLALLILALAMRHTTTRPRVETTRSDRT